MIAVLWVYPVWAHPRVGGDGLLVPRQSPRHKGSPPRGRGRLGRMTPTGTCEGLTPAWAGTAVRVRKPTRPPRAHPRVGGDGGADQLRLPWCRGLTPAWAGTAYLYRLLRSLRRAHPRVGGDGLTTSDRRSSARGSPPRGRGRRQFVPGGRDVGGLTPAWAGTATRLETPTDSTRAHPRVGGDGPEASRGLIWRRGSPPRGRGRPPTADTCCPGRGLTPAWAGTADRRLPRLGPSRAHPRVGGDGDGCEKSCQRQRGSPPRGRGRLRSLRSQGALEGLTPAWAGTAREAVDAHCRTGAHPRVGGDGERRAADAERKAGSPPRGRGRPLGAPVADSVGGLTPAWAGTAAIDFDPLLTLGAHPRVGGDGGRRGCPRRKVQGSPPRGRGRPSGVLQVHPLQGLTPAWAGTATRLETPTDSTRAHPRVGGDGLTTSDRRSSARGSPPRGRGRP